MTALLRLFLPVLVSVTVVACGGGGDSTAATDTSPGGIVAGPGAARLAWTPPTLNADDSPLTDLAGYRIYYGTSRDSMTQSATVEDSSATSYVVNGLATGTYYFTVAAYNRRGEESDRAAVAAYTFQ